MTSTLITGGARSGKSRFAQQIALETAGPVLFVATAQAGDEEMKRRIEEHRRTRPTAWTTLEAPTGIGEEILKHSGGAQTIIVDCITMLLNNVFMKFGQEPDSRIESEVMTEISGLTGCFERLDAGFVIVTNEIGLGLVPADRTSRLYRDLLGKANQTLAQYADRVFMMVAGFPVKIK